MNSTNRRVVNGINTVVIHGKDYIEVAERLRLLHDLKKEFEIIESEPHQYAERWVWRVVAKVGGEQYIGSAEVKLTNAVKGSPDSTNPWECAETSAVGRCLAFAGLGTIESIASYDEVMRGQPFTAVIEQRASGIVDAAPETRQIEVPQRPPLVQAMLDARSAGLITGTTKEERTASWEEQVIMIFGKLISAEEQAKAENIAKINAAITRHKGVAKSA